jgi:endonuclease/exonuclease/phosphatase family metal-dependent hydrolase
MMRLSYAWIGVWLLAGCSFAADKAPERLVVATWNVEWMFDHETGDNRSDLSKQQSSPNLEYWHAKVVHVATAIAATKATIIALEEIEGDQTLAAVAEELKKNHQLSYRYAFIQGTDRFTEQDVGILYQTGLTEYRRHEQSKEMFESNRYYNLSKHLVTKFQWAKVQSPLTLMAVHFRATAEAEDFRIRQARLARYFLQPQIDLAQDVVLLGDMNCEHAPGESVGDAKELVEPNPAAGLIDLLKFASSDNQRTHLILDKSYDRIFVSPSMIEDGPGLDWVFQKIEVRKDLNIRGQVDGKEHWDNRLTMSWAELDTSDHFPIVAEFELK